METRQDRYLIATIMIVLFVVSTVLCENGQENSPLSIEFPSHPPNKHQGYSHPQNKHQGYSHPQNMIDSYKMEYPAYLDSLSEEQREEELANNVPKRKPKSELAVKKGKKMKQVRIKDICSNSQHSRTKEDEEEDDENDQGEVPAVITKRKATDVFSREPSQPPKDPFSIFKGISHEEHTMNDYMKKGYHNEKKAEKVWKAMSEKGKEKYKLKLDELKQKYFRDYKVFLSTLNPEELNTLTAHNMNPMVAQQKDDESGWEESESSSDSSSVSGKSEATETKGKDKKKYTSSGESSSSSDDSDSD